MNKNELVAKVAESADLSKADAGRAVEAFIESVVGELKRDGEVRIVGFGTFSLSKREGGQGRNPRTGEPITVQPSKVVRFRAGKQLKDAVNG